MKKDDYHSVMDTMTLENGLPWTIPITLSTTKDEAKGLKQGERLPLPTRAATCSRFSR